jgi:hypothetical protein
MRNKTLVTMLLMLLFSIVSCSTVGPTSSISTIHPTSSLSISTTIEEYIDSFPYSTLIFPNYLILNPIRYLNEDDRGMKYNGWQDFGYTGEFLTHPWPWTTYTYQMYSYYIRNDLHLLYQNIPLPEKLEDLPQWITHEKQDGRRIIWYSMGNRLPEVITLLHTEIIMSYNQISTFIRAEYIVEINEKIENWIIYFMEENGVYSSYSVLVNEYYDSVLSTTSSMIQSYQKKTEE